MSYTGKAKFLRIVGPLLGMRIRGGNMDGGNGWNRLLKKNQVTAYVCRRGKC